MAADPWSVLACLVQLAAGGFSPLVVPLALFFCFRFPEEWWSRFVAANSVWHCTAIWMPVVAITAYWLNGLFLLGMDAFARPEVLRQFKIQPDKRFDEQQLFKVCKNILFNQIFVILPYAYACAELGLRSPIHVVMEPSLPSGRRLFLEMVGFVLFDEVVFYYSHWLLHSKVGGVNFYTKIHKIHHEFTAPIGLVASYCHPVEMLVSNAMPLTFGGCLMGAHAYSQLVWILFAILGTQFHHSGYRFPWVPFVEHNPDFHDFHHQRFVCNYGLLGVLDRLHGTDRLWREATCRPDCQPVKPLSGAVTGGVAAALLACLASQLVAA